MNLLITLFFMYVTLTVIVFLSLFLYSIYIIIKNKDILEVNKAKVDDYLKNHLCSKDVMEYLDKNDDSMIGSTNFLYFVFFVSSLKQALWAPNLIRIPLTYTKRVKIFDAAILSSILSFEEIYAIVLRNNINYFNDDKYRDELESQKVKILSLENKLETTLKAVG